MTVEASCESMYMLPVGEWLHIQKFYLSFRYRRDLYQSLLIIYMDTVCLFLMTNLRGSLVVCSLWTCDSNCNAALCIINGASNPALSLRDLSLLSYVHTGK